MTRRPLRLALLAHLAAAACSAPNDLPDAATADAATADAATADAATADAATADAATADAATTDAAGLGERATAVLRPAFAARPSSLSQCVGGVSVIVTPRAELVQGWGATALGGDAVPNEDTLFQIGSLTKVYTGLAAARLVEEGTVTASAPVGELLGPDLRGAVSRWPTLGALLAHHGGLPVFPGNLVDRDGDGRRDPGIDERSPAAGYDRGHLRSALLAWTPPAMAGYLYSNFGSGLVGLALQDRLGLPSYDAVLRRLVTADLGLRDTWGEVAAMPAAARSRLAAGYAVDGATRSAGIPGEMGVLASAGEIVTSGRDMRGLLRALVGLDASPLRAAIARATTPLAAGPEGRSMGYAVEIETTAGGVRYRKGGNTSSYGAYLIWSTAPPAGVAVLTNCGRFMTVVGLAEALHDIARGP